MLNFNLNKYSINEPNVKRITIKKNITTYNFFTFITFALVLLFFFLFTQTKYNNYFKLNFNVIDELLLKNGFKLQNIEILGTNNLSRDDVLKVVNSENNSSILNINLSKIYDKLILNNWIKTLNVERVLPNTIKIKIIENQPIAIWQTISGNKLITKDGKTITPKNINRFTNDLPIINGEEANKNIFLILKILKKNQEFSKNIWSLSYVSKRRWNLHFKQGLVVLLPHNEVINAWEILIDLQKKYKVLELGLTEIDIRNPTQILGKINFDKKLILKRKVL